MPVLEELGWDADWASSFEQVQEDNSTAGRVAAQHRGAYVVWAADAELRAHAAGRLCYVHEVGAPIPAVGDWVGIQRNGDAATITSILPRRSAFLRKRAGFGSEEQVLAANVDTAFLLAGLDDDFSLRRLERYITTAWDSGAAPVVVLTKADLCTDVADAALAVESVAIGVPVQPVSNVTGEGIAELAPHLRPGRTVALLGSSGVGKSTLVNRWLGEDAMATHETREDDDEGRHTTTHRQLLTLPGGGLVIDTPGLRELQLWDVGAAGLDATFTDVEELAADCRFGDCTHVHEPGCAVLAAVESGELPRERLDSWRKLQRELRAIAMRHDAVLRKEEVRKWKRRAREGRARARLR